MILPEVIKEMPYGENINVFDGFPEIHQYFPYQNFPFS